MLSVRNLSASFHTRAGIVRAVRNVSFDVAPGETLGIVGESGSGKSVTCYSIMGLIPMPPGRIESGSAMLDGTDLLRCPEKELRAIRGKRISMIFQDPMTSLNPYLTIGEQVAEPLVIHEGAGKKEARTRALEQLALAGIPDAEQRMDAYPHQFSGGMRQRVMIAMALITRPEILIADEPTTALDVTVQKQVLDLIKKLQQDMGTSVILITHDLGVVAQICDRVAIMYCGEIVEYGTIEEVFSHPAHPYTIGLFGSIPTLDEKSDHLNPIMGQVADPTDLPAGCCFNPRCPYAGDICRYEKPQRTIQNGTHAVCCHAAQGIFEQRELEEVIRIGRE